MYGSALNLTIITLIYVKASLLENGSLVITIANTLLLKFGEKYTFWWKKYDLVKKKLIFFLWENLKNPKHTNYS